MRPTNEEWLNGKRTTKPIPPTTRTIPVSDGLDSLYGIHVDLTNADHTGAIQETALHISGGWDTAISFETSRGGTVGITIEDRYDGGAGGIAPDCLFKAVLGDGTEVILSTLVVDGVCP